MASVSSLGVGSGLDAESIISALMSTERRPLQIMQTEASKLSSEISVWGTLNSHVSTFQDAAQDLASVSIWNQVKASTSNATALSVTSDSGATPGSHLVNITRLATGQTVSSAALSSSESTLSAGTLTLELGSWSGNTFTAKAGTSPKPVTIAATDTLEQIRDKINAAGAGVTASIVTDANGARLAMRSNDTGATNGFRITASETVDDGNAASGLSMLGFTATDGTAQMSLSQSALNATLTVDGIPISSASNTVTGALQGVTLELNEVTTTAAEVSIETDTEEITKAVDGFVTAFNTLMNYLKTQTKYDAATKKGGPLQGDSAAVGMISQMRNVINQDFTGGGAFARLADVGIEMNKDGTLSKSTTDFDNALGNLTDLKALFSADGDGSTGSTGFMQRFDDWAGQVLGTDGTIESRKNGLQATLDRNEDRQDAMEVRLEQTEKRLRAQYEALDQMMAKLSGTSSYVTQMINTLG